MTSEANASNKQPQTLAVSASISLPILTRYNAWSPSTTYTVLKVGVK
jgi:hypothetical protein